MGNRRDDWFAALSRRDALRLLGVGAATAGATAFLGDLDALAAMLQAGGRSKAVTFPKGAIIRTVLKDIPPEEIAGGATLVHEHMSLTNWRNPPPRPRRFMEDVDLMVEELKAAKKDGIACLVDCGHPEMGRKLDDLRTMSMRSGMPIVASGGHYTQVSYPPEVSRMPEDELVEALVKEVGSGHLGAFGEIGSSKELTADERKVFRAVGKAHLRTRLPIITHTDNSKEDTGKAALEQLDLLEAVGVKPEHVVIGHLDGLNDPDVKVHREIAKRGAFVGFDRVGSQSALVDDAARVRNIMKFLEAGYAGRLILSSDFANEKNTKKGGGPGYAMTLTQFVPKLRAAGVSDAVLHGVMVDNPRRLLAFVPPATSKNRSS
jgi:phosphotriesterase-related protein